jgi:drug/metabolite transporter (DMT)-like permease
MMFPGVMTERRKRIEGLVLGIIGTLAFSLTLPVTRGVVPELGAPFVGVCRALAAAIPAALLLLVLREPLPERRHWPGLFMIALGAGLAFPLFSAIALRSLPSAHSAVVVGLLPAATAAFAVLFAGERPRLGFWIACAGGVIAVLVFAAVEGAGRPQLPDLLLLIAVLGGGIAYAQGGRLSHEMGGWRVISWALVFGAPFLLVPAIVVIIMDHVRLSAASPEAWLAFAYVALISQFVAFFPWYRGLMLAGVARTSQIGLAQPVLTLGWSALLLREHISLLTLLVSLLVIAAAAATQFTRVTPAGSKDPAPHEGSAGSKDPAPQPD